MSDPQPFADAIEAAMAAEGVAYAEGRKPAVANGLPYVVGWMAPGRIFDASLRARDGFALTLVLQCYGLSMESVRVAVRKARAAVASLNGTSVGDRVVLRPYQDEPPPPQRDDDADPPLWWQSEVWRLPTSLA